MDDNATAKHKLTVKYKIWPPVVDFPASTCPIKTTFMCSLQKETMLKTSLHHELSVQAQKRLE